MGQWARGFRLRQQIKGSLWFVPLIGGLIGVALAEVTGWLEPLVSVPAGWSYSASTAQGILIAIVGAMVSLLGFVVAIGTLVVQLATGTLSPRFMRLWFRDRLQKFVLATFVGSIALAFSLLRQVNAGRVPSIGVTVAGVAVGVSLVMLLLYFNRFAHFLRPVGVGELVAQRGLREAQRVTEMARRHHAEPATGPVVTDEPAATVAARRSGIIQAINTGALITVAQQYDCVLLLNASVGDFVPVGSAVIDIHATGRVPDPRLLAGLVALGNERSIEDDPGFACASWSTSRSGHCPPP